MDRLPSIRLGSLEVSRLLVGGNPMSGLSHQSEQRSRAMVEYFTVDRIKALWRACEERGITAMVARADAFIMRVFGEYRREGGRLAWVAQTAPEHRDALANIRLAAAAGASAVFVHGGDADRLFGEGDLGALRTRLDSIRALGLPAGLAAHDPANHLRAQAEGLPVDFHLVCLYNLAGYQGRRDSEPVEVFAPSDRVIAMRTLERLGPPCIAYKVLGAGRLSLEQGLEDVARALRPRDGVLLGMYPPDRPDIVGEAVSAVANLLRAPR